MGQQVTNRDVLPGGRGVSDEGVDVIIESEFAVLHEHEQSGGGEGFCHGCDLEDGIAPDGRFSFKIRQAVVTPYQNAVPLHYGNCNPGNPLGLHLFGDEVIQLIRRGAVRRLLPGLL